MKNKIFEQSFSKNGGGKSFLLKSLFFSLLMLGFFSCGKEVVVEPYSLIEGTVTNRDLGECECEMTFVGFENEDTEPSQWTFSNGEIELINKGVGGVQNSIEDRVLLDGDVFEIDKTGSFSLTWFFGGDLTISSSLSIEVEITCQRENGGGPEVSLYTFNFGNTVNCIVDEVDESETCTWEIESSVFDCGEELEEDPCNPGNLNWPDC